MVPPTIIAILAILACQLTGEVISQASHLPIPGPVLGMALMLSGLITSERLRDVIRPMAGTILGNLLLLFVPAGVGAMLQLGSLGGNTLPLLLAIVISALAAIAVAALTFVLVARLTGDVSGKEDSKEGML
ncbi:CidA/LrgA family protein [Rhodobacter sp. 24-YEA-8]|uniref:CidA/LrgA family protein n=1 Tax=Rhodobacter sp. 24-YEA-8 TaxID=1884310 RepID=UPI0008987EBF|nr:CidA/LrgA family protein [Rhodobacter sp. 24-YEA-8]SEB38532.1 holin-like protein [Rhodobacter sp. 24-YEA-8]